MSEGSLMLGLSSRLPLRGKGRNLEAVVWALLHPPCPLSDSDPLALLLHSAVRVSSSGEGRGLHPSHSGASCFKMHIIHLLVPVPPLQYALRQPTKSCLAKIRATE